MIQSARSGDAPARDRTERSLKRFSSKAWLTAARLVSYLVNQLRKDARHGVTCVGSGHREEMHLIAVVTRGIILILLRLLESGRFCVMREDRKCANNLMGLKGLPTKEF